MEIKRFKSLWEYVGFEGSPLAIRMPDDIEAVFRRIAEAGYDGVESPLPAADQEPMFRTLLERYGLAYVAQVLTDGPDHGRSFEAQVRRTLSYAPVLIVAQSGKDHQAPAEQEAFFRMALEVEASVGVPIAHETHRGRALFTPWRTAELLDRFDGLKLAADFSHWCCVTESLLEEHAEAMALACSRAIHIHGRVGHREGPQVADPRAPEYGWELSVHERWWQRIVRERAAQGAAQLIFTPEFGPPGYMPTLPYTGQPVADLWEVNRWMGERFVRLAEEALAEVDAQGSETEETR